MGKAVHPEALAQMRRLDREGSYWGAYENCALDSANAGHMQFLHIGEGCTYPTAPEQYPADTVHGMGWRYRLVGVVDLESGEVVEP